MKIHKIYPRALAYYCKRSYDARTASAWSWKNVTCKQCQHQRKKK